METNSSRNRVMRRLSMLCVLLVATVVGISAYIRLSSVGLGCSPWPQCYGQALRDGQQQAQTSTQAQSSPSVAAARLVHRFFAVSLLILMVVLVFGGFSTQSTPWEGRWLAVQALLLIVFLAGLGRWTAGTRVPAVVLGNLISGFLLLGVCWRMAKNGGSRANARPLSRASRIALTVGIAAILMQVVIGGLVSSGYTGLSCPQITDCAVATPVPWDMLNPMREPHVDVTIWPINPDGAVVHLLHRWMAAASALATVVAATLLLRDRRQRAAAALLVLVAAQLVLGLILVLLHLPLALAVLHNLLAAVLLGQLMSVD